MKPLVFGLAAVWALFGLHSAALALVLGLCLSLVLGNPFVVQTKRWAPWILQAAVVGLGASMNLGVVLRVGLQGVGYTALGIAATLGLGIGLGKLLRVERTTSLLVSAGTAICGGSAIAAVASVIGASSADMAFSLMTVFFLNAAALFLFPQLGHALHLSQSQFGLWSALAIHDTSSVVGAAGQYGAQALEVAVIIKLTRTLWILPLTFAIGLLVTRKTGGQSGPRKRPYFVLGFLLASALVTWIPALAPLGTKVTMLAKQAMVLSLFLIGANIDQRDLSKLSLRPFLLGFLLWTAASAGTLLAIFRGLIRSE
jgi:uncharacterized integral membrane protein (TIGR00698 family)